MFLRILLSPEQVATLTGLSLETLAQWRRRSVDPLCELERAVRYDPADVHTYIEGCRVFVSVPKKETNLSV
jgi:hypothetical protein